MNADIDERIKKIERDYKCGDLVRVTQRGVEQVGKIVGCSSYYVGFGSNWLVETLSGEYWSDVYRFPVAVFPSIYLEPVTTN